jgi:hypothetical protein
MTSFIYAAELKKTFRCYGHFYRLNILGIDPQLCRSVLEITSLPREAVGAGIDSDDLFGTESSPLSLPDAVVIMMNPGSSRPIEDGDTDSLLEFPLPDEFKKPLALTQPDNTQYQLMRIMAAKGWTHLRILNISDIRDPKSPSFIARTQALDGIPGGGRHSLFSEARAEERTSMFKRKPGAPFILGWGQDAGLLPLAKQCLRCIEGEKVVTIPSETNPILTAHPSPMMQVKKEEWIEKILGALVRSE